MPIQLSFDSQIYNDKMKKKAKVLEQFVPDLEPESSSIYRSLLARHYLDYLSSHELELPDKSFDLQKANSKLIMCPHSKIISKYIPAQKRYRSLVISCGKCYYCQHLKQNQLIYRIYNHSKSFTRKLFVTLTYNPEHYGLESHMKDDYQKFLKRLRRLSEAKTLSYYETCERGKKTGRLHHHMLLFWNDNISYSQMKSYVEDCWTANHRVFESLDAAKSKYKDRLKRKTRDSIGFVYFGVVNNRTITYVTKYTLKENKNLTVFHSWSNGLGYSVLEVDIDLVGKLRYLAVQSYQPDPSGKVYRVPTPSYYKNKLISVLERAKQFQEYLDSDYYNAKLAFLRNEASSAVLCDLDDAYITRTDNLQSVRDSLNSNLL